MIISLAGGGYTLDLAPLAGGGVAAFSFEGVPVFRPARPGAVEARDPLGLSCFPMAPWLNRIGDGRFRFGGRDVRLAGRGFPHALHGQAWLRGWDVSGTGRGHATLRVELGGDDWPWRCRASQTFQLGEDGLWVELDLENLDEEVMPAALGLHPYLLGLPHAELQARTSGMWATDEALLPTRLLVLPDAPSFDDWRPLAGTDLDNCFTGFDGEAWVRWADRPWSLRISAPDCRFMQVYTRGADGSFCVEAQSSAPDPFRLAADGHDAGLASVPPGGRFTCRTRFEVRPL